MTTTARPTDAVLTLAAAKKYLNMSETRDQDDDELAEFIATSVELVELVRREAILPVDVSETHLAGDSGAVMLDRTPVLEVRSVTGTDGRGPWPVDGLLVERLLGRITGPTERLCGPITIEYRAGRETIPALYRQAAKVILAHLWQTQRRPIGSGTRFGSSSAADSENITLAGWSLPRAAIELLGPPVPGVG